MGVWRLAPRENFEIYVNADANFSLSKVIFWHLVSTHKKQRFYQDDILCQCQSVNTGAPLTLTVQLVAATTAQCTLQCNTAAAVG